MGLAIVVTAVTEETVSFSARDREDEGMVSFNTDISLPHACFLAEHVLRSADCSAYAQLMRSIADEGVEAGQEFWD